MPPGARVAVEDVLGLGGAAAGDPAGNVTQVEPAQRGGVEVGAQVVGGLGGPERAVLDAALADRLGERVGAADRGRRVLAAVQRIPAERRRHVADALRIEHVDRAAAGADGGGQLEHVVLGRGGDDRPGVVEDDRRQPSGLACSRRALHDRVLFDREPKLVPVVRAADQDGVRRGGSESAFPERQSWAGASAAAQGGQLPPAQPQLDQGRVSCAGVKPQVEAEPQVADAVAGEAAVGERGQERPLDGDEQDCCGRCEDDEPCHLLASCVDARPG